MLFVFPKTQKELLIAARGNQSQAKFAALLGVDRSCLSRYEREELGAPTSVLNYCLNQLAQAHANNENGSPIRRALADVQRAAHTLEEVAKTETRSTPSKHHRHVAKN